MVPVSGAGSSVQTAGKLPVTVGRLQDFPDDPITCMRRLHQRHGGLAALEEEGNRLYFVFAPQWNQKVLSESQTFHSRFFAVRGPRNSSQRRLTSGLLSMNGQEHKQHRRMILGPFSKRTITTYHESIVELTRQMLADWETGQVRDLHTEMTQFMLRVTSGLLFGIDVFEMAYRLGEMIDQWVHVNHKAGLGAFISDPQYLREYDSLLQLAERLEEKVLELIDLRRSSSRNGNDVLSLLINAYEQEGGISNEQLVGHVALLFGAAHLTTAHTFTWTLFLLAQHPSVMKQLAEEMRQAFSGDAPTLQEAAGMPFLERVIKESMRILPASGYSQRVCAQPVQLGPFSLPRGAPVIFSQFITHHLPELFPQPEQFRPQRWEQISPGPYEYLPFGAGPRMCLGGPLALMILQTTLPAILKRFRLTVVPDAEINGSIVSTMLGPRTSVPVLLSPPDGRFEAVPVRGNIHTMVDLSETLPREREAWRRAA